MHVDINYFKMCNLVVLLFFFLHTFTAKTIHPIAHSSASFLHMMLRIHCHLSVPGRESNRAALYVQPMSYTSQTSVNYAAPCRCAAIKCLTKLISDVSDPAKGCKPAEVLKAPGGFIPQKTEFRNARFNIFYLDIFFDGGSVIDAYCDAHRTLVFHGYHINI